jgi:hypothetical protein
MRAHKCFVQGTGSKMNHGDNSVFITTYVKNIPVVPNAVGSIKSLPHIMKIFPVT